MNTYKVTPRDRAMDRWVSAQWNGQPQSTLPPASPDEVWVNDNGLGEWSVTLQYNRPVRLRGGYPTRWEEPGEIRWFIRVATRSEALSVIVTLMASGARLRHAIPSQTEWDERTAAGIAWALERRYW